jgi:competence protein ComEC
MQRSSIWVGLALLCSAQVIQAQQMDIYWIDSDGAAATLIVTPSRQTILVDSAFNRPGDIYSHRIRAAMQDAGVSQIDYFIATHYHGDHIGGITALAKMVPVIEFIDHGETTLTDEGGLESYQRYIENTESRKRTSVSPHMILPLRGVDVTVIASHKEFLREPLMGSPEPNSICATADPSGVYCRGTECESTGMDFEGEDIYSVGIHLSMGDFQYVNVGDLSYGGLHALVCPTNNVGTIDLLDYPHHGNNIAPQFVSSLAPIAAVSSGGAHKGGSPEGYEAATSSPGLESFWQMHRALDTDDAHNTEARKTANLSDENDQAHWIKAEIEADGSSFTITNARNQYSETYTTR